MNKKQQRRAEVLAKVSSGGISKTEAENLLGLGRRQIDRLLRKYEKERLKVVIHGNSGRVPVNKTPQSLIDSMIEFAGEDGKYHGLNTCHLHDLLEENCLIISVLRMKNTCIKYLQSMQHSITISRERTRELVGKLQCYPKNPHKQ